ncbi:ribosome biogenesis GTPase Der [Candidatus Karelsulcia muelleri]|uniref:ribosome biogenesis GTPase Der n=1 Tax=Candidatus Karelsulcia muelleri TaxID=336810 RepID=UPI0023647B63|nr:ribosome biogenesis GTPase Der [Candidatus Karelsulcia muelleri]WDE42169.1 ribosome biogenesis GTPase Der [Candidatus Karelsulcia muelleri]WDR79158.1 ribosome biogenesis GTPase Der [Candidatus Karelsulcia muelleri]
MKKIISIVGHTNVGKSTLFNYLVGYRKAITDYTHGVTRDRIYCECKWRGNNFTLIDSGGYVFGTKELEKKIIEQFLLAIEEASDIIFILDILSGILPIDYKICNILQRSKKKVFIAINKIDKYKYTIFDIKEVFNLGFKYFFFISSLNGIGINELLDSIFVDANESYKNVINYNLSILPRITIVGRKNVGKSSLINTLLNKKQRIVCDQPGTTRDGIEVFYKKFNFKCILIDTAGFLKNKIKSEYIEYFSFLRTTKFISSSDLCFFMLDVKIGFNKQDLKVFNFIKKKIISIIILINKCDLIKEKNELQKLKNNILKKIYPFTDVPIYFISNYTKKNIIKAFKKGINIINKQKKNISTSSFKKIMLTIIERNQFRNRNKFAIKYCVPIFKKGINQFIFFSKNPNLIPSSYKRFLEKKIRENFDLVGIPIKIKLLKMSKLKKKNILLYE